MLQEGDYCLLFEWNSCLPYKFLSEMLVLFLCVHLVFSAQTTTALLMRIFSSMAGLTM